MANIDDELQTIKNAGRGEDVRAAIIAAIKKIYNEREYPPTTLKVKNNGTIEGGPWNKVVVDVDGAISKLDIDCPTGAITENGFYRLEDLKNMGLITNPNCVGIDGFEISVKQVPGEFGEINITANGIYDPLLDGYDGYSKVYVNVLGGDLKDSYTVRFFDGKSLLESKVVPRGSNATYTGSRQLSGANFTGWNPSPVNVSRDMDCYAVYASGALGTLIDKYTSTISDSWAQICEKIASGTRPYPVGSTKILELVGLDGNNYILTMCLIGYNLDKDVNGKLVSTWMNIQNVGNEGQDNNILPRFTLAPNGRSQNVTACNGHTTWWGNSLMRAVFNSDPSEIAYNTNPGNDDTTYYSALAAQNMLLGQVMDRAAGTNLFSRIKTVIKYSFWYDRNTGGSNFPKRDQPTYDKIWLPSSRELAFPIINNSSADPSYTIPDYMCSIGAVDHNGDQYGNPNMYAQTCFAVGVYGVASGNYLRTRDVAKDNSYIMNIYSTIHRDNNPGVKNHTYITTGGQTHFNYNGYFLPISFCL